MADGAAVPRSRRAQPAARPARSRSRKKARSWCRRHQANAQTSLTGIEKRHERHAPTLPWTAPLLGSASLRNDAIKSQCGALATKIVHVRKRRRSALTRASIKLFISMSYAKAVPALAALGSHHLDSEIANFLAQSVAVKPQKIGGANLVSAGRNQRCRDQRQLDFLQNAAVETG